MGPKMAAEDSNPNIYNVEKRELNLSLRDLHEIPADILEQFAEETEYLDLSHNRLTSIKCIYEFPNLQYLILDNNRLNEAHFRELEHPLPRLQTLMLNKNELIDFVDTVALISKLFPNLVYLSLHGNPICPDGLGLKPFAEYISYEYDQYRSHITNALTKLKFLDHSSVKQQFLGSGPHSNTRVLKMLWSRLKAALPTKMPGTLLESSTSATGTHSGVVRAASEAEVAHNENDSEDKE